ncbi:bifunctional transcriptional activator/DNA repair enzyme AdaA [Algicella marina]|uniref:methylated-DNA--[protein]-cysteine S-methyltransferase n=1 Tax=Algicella marina TaxID=2683284 RepID=A0A6P1T520_9RHOB|nr:trifunctional transcriptional activator/DNA repair protein Ada/methylated-DNA--[protein]-cysteine S-methyltransferase [Algicella marina]QHQ37117.1 methylated-DNA--[protein]-cysteine S-methyltransferase [Algicella marina]
MLFALPDNSTLYKALLSRDETWEGRAYVCVSSTGIFCRLTCPARKPKPENCAFRETIAECIAEGFRPCKRCKPLESAPADPVVATLATELTADPSRRWSEADLTGRGLDPSTIRRAFKRHYGMTFLEMARATRLKAGAAALADGASVIDAQLEAGFSSGAGFRTAFARLLGRAPGSFTGDEPLKAHWIDTPIGEMIAVADAHALHILEFFSRRAISTELAALQKATGQPIGIGRTAVTEQMEAELTAFFAGESGQFSTRIAPLGTPFRQKVWRALRAIPPGETRSYADIAREIGQPTATRAVAQANGANPIALVIPCHRVIGADGTLTGYGGGLWRKQWLISHERGLAQVTA